MLKVIKPGGLSLIQDGGRFGYQSKGFCNSGMMDEHAGFWANRLLDNAADAPLLEMNLPGAEFSFERPATIAITGADFVAELNGISINNWASHQLQAGDNIAFRGARAGQRAYLAVKDGIQLLPKHMLQLGSVSTCVREQLGGERGQPLYAGQKLGFSASQTRSRFVATEYIPRYRNELRLQCVKGPHWSQFDAASQQAWLDESFLVTPQQDRMGYRLAGPALCYHGPELVSEPTSLGAVQVPDNGQAIVLMKDRQTIGGYPKIANLTRLSCFALSQAQAGTRISFELITLTQAKKQLAEFYSFFF